MKKSLFAIFAFIIMVTSQNVIAQSRLSLTPGLFYNGTTFDKDVSGFGAILGLEYMKSKEHFFSMELRTKYAYYSFDDGTKWREDKDGVPKPPVNRDEARLEYSLFSPQVGLVPKFHVLLDESFSLFLENEFSAGLMSGSFKYKGTEEKQRFTEPTLSYNIGIGIETKLNKYAFVGSVGYSTLNFRSNIVKHKPPYHTEYIPNQNTGLWINIIIKVPIA